jgi:hypothetical protein
LVLALWVDCEQGSRLFDVLHLNDSLDDDSGALDLENTEEHGASLVRCGAALDAAKSTSLRTTQLKNRDASNLHHVFTAKSLKAALLLSLRVPPTSEL